jgi:hypothetical protein
MGHFGSFYEAVSIGGWDESYSKHNAPRSVEPTAAAMSPPAETEDLK